MRGYTTREVAEALDLPVSRILDWTRRGLLTPHRRSGRSHVFSFQDIVLLRTARELMARRIPARRVLAALESLREQLPAGRPLSGVRIVASGDHLLVRDAGALWEPGTGQLALDFTVADVAKRVAPIARSALEATSPSDLDADGWYDTALDLEAVSLPQAAGAYDRALELDPLHAPAHLNLGRLRHEQGRLDDAERHYRAALGADPADGTACYNLGVLLEDRGRTREAIGAYRDALTRDACLATAHFNLSRLLESSGERAEALGHLAAYKRLLDAGS